MYLTGWVDQGLAFDTCVHLGSLIAVLWYFRQDLYEMMLAVWKHLIQRVPSSESRFAFNLLLASLPIIPAGYLLKDLVASDLRSAGVIATATLLFGVVLWWADRSHQQSKPDSELDWKSALFIGLVQCLALVPGASRSGVTMTAALLAGHSRKAASRISFLLSIPAILGASTLNIVELVHARESVDWTPLVTGTLVAGVSAYACIHLFLKWIEKIGFTPFVIYRLLLGTALLIWISLGW